MSLEEIESIHQEFKTELMLAKADYIRKKRLKGETVDRTKLRMAMNGRKKIKQLGNKLMALHLRQTNILNKPAIENMADEFEKRS